MSVRLLTILLTNILAVRLIKRLPLSILGTPPTAPLRLVGLLTEVNPILKTTPFRLATMGLLPPTFTCSLGRLFRFLSVPSIGAMVRGNILMGSVKAALSPLISPESLIIITNLPVRLLMTPLWARVVLLFPIRPTVGLILLVLLTVRLTLLTLLRAARGTLHRPVSIDVRKDAGIFPTPSTLLVVSCLLTNRTVKVAADLAFRFIMAPDRICVVVR